MEHRRAQHDVGERELRVLARVAAAGEERLQRLRGELDYAVALDAAGPAALEIVLRRTEHAELHGSVCTITSEISGRSRRISSSTRLASACATESCVPPSSAQREIRDEPVVGVEETELQRIAAGLAAHDPRDGLGVARDLRVGRPRAGALLGQRLEMRLHRRDLGRAR